MKNKLKDASTRRHIASLDIEMDGYRSGRIVMVGIAKRVLGRVEYRHFVLYKNLTRAALEDYLADVDCLLTFNGKCHDLWRLRKKYPGIIRQHVERIDLYQEAKRLGLGGPLRSLEKMFDIPRQEGELPTILWLRYMLGDMQALDALIKKNKQDAENLFELLDKLAITKKNYKFFIINEVILKINTDYSRLWI